MQQHTGQHLISSVLERGWKGSAKGEGKSIWGDEEDDGIAWDPIETLGWSMGQSVASSLPKLLDPSIKSEDPSSSPTPNMSFIEIPVKPTPQQIIAIQRRCNDIVAQALNITVKTPLDAKTGSLPKDYDISQGVVRVICIDGIDENT